MVWYLWGNADRHIFTLDNLVTFRDFIHKIHDIAPAITTSLKNGQKLMTRRDTKADSFRVNSDGFGWKAFSRSLCHQIFDSGSGGRCLKSRERELRKEKRRNNGILTRSRKPSGVKKNWWNKDIKEKMGTGRRGEVLRCSRKEKIRCVNKKNKFPVPVL